MNAGLPTDSGATPLLLLPGTLCDGEVFGPMLDLVRTAHPRRPYKLETLAGGNTVEAVAARILGEAPEQFAVLGFSLGGIVALAIATIAPHRVLGLGLIDSNARDVPQADRAARREEALRGSTDLSRHVGQTLWPRYVGAAAQNDETIRRTVVDMALRVGSQALTPQTDIGLSRPDSRPRLGDLTMPALVLAGAEDALCPPSMQEEMARALPSAALALIPGAGHFALLEKPDHVAAPVTAWLDRVDEHRASPPASRPPSRLRQS